MARDGREQAKSVRPFAAISACRNVRATDTIRLQVPPVARPRNQLYLDHEVAAGIWRPYAVSGCAQHPRQVTLQRDLQALAIRLEQDPFDQRPDGFSRPRATLLALQRKTEATNLLAIDVGHSRV